MKMMNYCHIQGLLEGEEPGEDELTNIDEKTAMNHISPR